MCDTTGVTSISLRNPDLSEDSNSHIHHHHHHPPHAPSSNKSSKHGSGNNDEGYSSGKQNQVGSVMLFGVPIVSLVMEAKERLCLAQISSTLLKDFSYNEIHNRRVALGITCVQCTPVQLEILRRAGAMPVTSRRCGMITRREAERLCQSFLGDHAPPQLPENFAFEVYHECGWGSRGSFVPSRYNSSRAKCIRCTYCQLFWSPNKFIFHSHRLPESRYVQPDAANFNSWRRHLKLCGDPPEDDTSISSNTLSMDTAQIVHAWEDVRAMFNGGTRKRMLAAHSSSHHHHSQTHGHGHSSSRNENQGHTHRRGVPKQQPILSNGSTGGGEQNRSSKPTTAQLHSSRHQHQPPSNHNHGLINPRECSPLPSFSNSNATTSSSLTNNSSSSPNNFLPLSTNPLLSPSARLDIWNPGLSPVTMSSAGRLAAAAAGLGTVQQQLSHLPFHPLSIPWLRRPLFPFPHPFAPAACHLLAADAAMTVPEKLATLSGVGVGRSASNQSAFKPVSRSNAEHLFSWLNNNNPTNGNGGPSLGGSLPEDLSTTSNHHHNHVGIVNHHHLLTNPFGRERSSSHDRSPVSSTNDENPNSSSGKLLSSLNTIKRGGNAHSARHQIQILSSAAKNDSDDEETVDIESTEVEQEEECSSTSFFWVTSTNNNNNNSVNINLSRKRLSVDSNNSDSESTSGEDEKFSGDESCSSPPKRKRLWDFDASDTVKKPELKVCCDEPTRTGAFGPSKE